jgi:putative transposase
VTGPRPRTMRYPGYDYRLPGGYFVTIVLASRQSRFGEVRHAQMIPNEAGHMLYETWAALPDRYPSVILDEMIVMPDHLHGILFLTGDATEDTPSLSEVVRVFKSISTRRYIHGVTAMGWPRFDRYLWQPNFYDHIIRNDHDLETRRRYIEVNPARWEAKRRGHE